MAERHEHWMARYGRTYHDALEKERRFEIFKENVELIESFNAAKDKPYKLSVNEFADLTNEEFKSSRNGYKRHNGVSSTEATSFRYENVTIVPSSMDWRDKGAVTPVKDQGLCGKLYAKNTPTKSTTCIAHAQRILVFNFLVIIILRGRVYIFIVCSIKFISFFLLLVMVLGLQALVGLFQQLQL